MNCNVAAFRAEGDTGQHNKIKINDSGSQKGPLAGDTHLRMKIDSRLISAPIRDRKRIGRRWTLVSSLHRTLLAATSFNLLLRVALGTAEAF